MAGMDLWTPQQGKHFEEINSTNDWLKKQQPQVGAWVRADFQTQGRGRRDHSWHSPASGNLYMSICVPRIEPLPLISLAVANGVVEFCESHKEKVGLKWPNDILINGQKCGGILSEVLENVVVVGIGLNLSSNNLFEGAGFLDLKNKNLVELAENFVNYLPKWTSEGVSAKFVQEKWLQNRGGRVGHFSYKERSLKGYIRELDLEQNHLLLESDEGVVLVQPALLQEFL